MATTAAGITTTTVSTDQLAPLGFKLNVPASSGGDTQAGQGEQVWVYVKAEAALAVGDIVVRDASALTNDMYGVTPSASGAPALAAHSVLGVAQHVIASGSFGFVQCKGQCLVKCGTANISQDIAIMSSGDRLGAALDFAAGGEHCVFGFSLEAETDNNTTFDAYVNCPGA